MSSLTSLRLLASAIGAVASAAAVSLTQFHVPVRENFDTLAITGTSAVLPAGWSFIESGSGANPTYAAGTGSASTGNTYSFGTSGSVERALGSVRSASVAAVWGVGVINATGSVLAGLDVSFVGEQWRLGATGRSDRIEFAYSLDATALGLGTWVEVNELDFVAPVAAGTVGALNGNLAANRSSRAFSLTGLDLPAGAGMWLRWSDFDASGADDGLAIDEVVLTARPVEQAPVPDGWPPGAGALVIAGVVALAVSGGRKAGV
jgi:hypothetical protein